MRCVVIARWLIVGRRSSMACPPFLNCACVPTAKHPNANTSAAPHLPRLFMKQGKRFGLSAEQKSDVWRRWKSGQTLHEIGRAFGKEHSSIRCLVSRHGGIAPAVRRRALLALTLREREEISRGLASGASTREIAKCLERAVSTVSREVARHGGRPAYRASQADGAACHAALRPKRCLLSINLKLRNIVASKLILDWSPQKTSGWLKTQD